MKFIKHVSLAALLVFAFSVALIAQEEDSGKTDGIQWVSYDVGLEKAAQEKKHVFIDFTAKWCGYCKKMDRETFSKPEVITMLNEHFVPVKVDGDSKNELNIDGYKITESNLTKQEFGVRGYPTFWFLKPDGSKLGAISGYRPADVMIDALTFVKEEKYDTTKAQPENEDKSGE